MRWYFHAARHSDASLYPFQRPFPSNRTYFTADTCLTKAHGRDERAKFDCNQFSVSRAYPPYFPCAALSRINASLASVANCELRSLQVGLSRKREPGALLWVRVLLLQ
jgi:hypothetical protein